MSDHTFVLAARAPYRCVCGRTWVALRGGSVAMDAEEQQQEPDADGYYACPCTTARRWTWRMDAPT